jgi:hypothetical protein
VPLPAYAFAAVLSAATLIPNTAAAISNPRPASCLDRLADVATIRNDFGSSQYANTIGAPRVGVDAFDSIWRPVPVNNRPSPSSIIVTTGIKGCWVGGRVLGRSVQQLEDPQGAAAAISISGQPTTPIDFELEWVEVYDVPRAIELSSTLGRLRLNQVFLRQIQGACISFRGSVHTLIIRNTLIDGCSYLVNNTSDNSWKKTRQFSIRDSLIRLQSKQNKTSQEIRAIPTETQPKISVVNSTFLLDGPVSLLRSLVAGSEVSIGECRGNIVILGNRGTVIGPLPPCFRIMTNQAVWTASKKAWLEARKRQVRYNDLHRPQPEEMASNDPSGSRDLNLDGGAGDQGNSNDDPNASQGGQAPSSGESSLFSVVPQAAIQPPSGSVLGAGWSDGTMWNDKTGWF